MRAGGAILAAVSWAIAKAAFAHDTFIIPPASVTAGEPVVVQVTSSGFFPEPETRIRPARIGQIDARADGVPLDWTATNDEVAMTLTTSPAASAATGAVIVMSLKPYDIDVEVAEISHYMDEIAAPPEVRAAVEASVAADGVLAETYTKHLKTIVCGTTCADNEGPGGGTFEFVAEPTGGRAFTLFLYGAPVANQPAFVVTETTGRTPLTTDAEGRVVLPDDLTGLVYLNAVKLAPPTYPGDRFASQWASLTFDARLLGE